MRKKAKKIIFWSVGGYVVSMLIILGLVWLYMWSPWLKKPTLEYYSNNDNYHLAEGCISEVSDCPFLYFEWVEYDNMRVTNMRQISPHNRSMKIYSSDVKKVWEELSPRDGMVFSFTFARGKIDPPLSAPIVQIVLQGKEILSFEDGKAALLDRLK